MLRLRYLFLIPIAFVLLLIFNPTKVFATSIYDSLIINTSDYSIFANNYYGVSSVQPVNVSTWNVNFNNPSWYYQGNLDSPTATAFRANVASIRASENYSYIVIDRTEYQSSYTDRYYRYKHVIMCANQITFQWHDELAGGQHFISVSGHCDDGVETIITFPQVQWGQGGTSTPAYSNMSARGSLAIGVGNGTPDIRVVEHVGIAPTYPIGYAGAPMSGVYLQPLYIHPQGRFSVADKHVVIQDKSLNFPETWGNWHMRYEILGTDGTTVLKTFNENGASQVEYDLPAIGNYKVRMTFLNSANEIYPDNEAQKTYLTPLIMNLNIDGSTYTSDTRDASASCDSSGVCTPADGTAVVYEDCATFGLNVGGAIGCHLGNFSKWFERFFGFDGQNPLLNMSQDTFGLTSIITSPLVVLTQMQSQSYACTPIGLTLPFVNVPLNLPCLTSIYQSNFGTAFTLYQTVITGVVSYYVVVRILADVKGYKDPKNDQIEVLKL